jgi:hypothetical protein
MGTVEIHHKLLGLGITDPVGPSPIFEYLALRLHPSFFAYCCVCVVCRRKKEPVLFINSKFLHLNETYCCCFTLVLLVNVRIAVRYTCLL